MVLKKQLLFRKISAHHDVIIVEGLVPMDKSLRKSMQHWLKPVRKLAVSTADLADPRKTAEKVDAHLRQFGGAASLTQAYCSCEPNFLMALLKSQSPLIQVYV